MSETEVHKGKLTPMVLDGWNLEERAASACNKLGIPFDADYDTWLETLQEHGYGKIFILGDVIYELKDQELDAYGFTEVQQNDDGTIDYFVMYYNGGASMEEVLEAELNRMDKG